MIYKNIFDSDSQQLDVNAKLTIALEKMGEIMRVLQWEEAKQHNLSPIQLQVLVFLATHKEAFKNPTKLAAEFNLTRPTISDALKSLESKYLIAREKNIHDSRSFNLILTPLGQHLADSACEYPRSIYNEIQKLKSREKEVMLRSMIEIIQRLSNQGIIHNKRICFSCKNYRGNRIETHHCLLLHSDLKTNLLRIDCPEHEEVVS